MTKTRANNSAPEFRKNPGQSLWLCRSGIQASAAKPVAATTHDSMVSKFVSGVFPAPFTETPPPPDQRIIFSRQSPGLQLLAVSAERYYLRAVVPMQLL
jgi:hypothetical protein